MSEATALSAPARPAPERAPEPDVLLVGAVPTTQPRPAPARDLYTGALFARRARYADEAGKPWYVLSAQRGLVAADEVVAPSEVDLAARSASYRAAWGAFVAEQVREALGPRAAVGEELGSRGGAAVELHADPVQADALRGPLESAGLAVVEPAPTRSRREAIAWYDDHRRPARREAAPAAAGTGRASGPAAVETALRALTDSGSAQRVPDLVAAGPAGCDGPGLYSWWVDDAGAQDLTAGLGLPVTAGLLYVGQAGATSPVTGRPSTATVWNRVGHEHGRGSTFTRTLAAVLAEPLGLRDADDPRLGAWIDEHLRVVTLAVDDPVALAALEEAVLAALEPPLNLQGMRETPVHRRLRELRRAAAPA